MELKLPFLAELQSLADQMASEQSARPLTAHYFAGGKTKTLVISESNRPTGKTVRVSGLREARKVAAEHGAQPWNF